MNQTKQPTPKLLQPELTTSKEQVVDPRFSYFNVEDRFKGLEIEEIRSVLEANAFPGAVAMMNLQGDFNFSSVVRNANAFGITTVFYVGGKRHWDRRGAVGTHNYINVVHCPTVLDLLELTTEYRWVALENQVEYPCVSIYDFEWPEKMLLLVGEEGQGLEDPVLELCSHYVTIPQYGSVRSINAATATGIAMNHYAQQMSQRNLL